MKLDGSLVREITHDDRIRELVDSIMQQSKSLDFMIIAECVETAEQKDALEQMGCLLYQGFLFEPAVDKNTLVGMGHTK